MVGVAIQSCLPFFREDCNMDALLGIRSKTSYYTGNRAMLTLEKGRGADTVLPSGHSHFSQLPTEPPVHRRLLCAFSVRDRAVKQK